ncbi:hypothetical protein D9M69_452110 [compost metagenome]
MTDNTLGTESRWGQFHGRRAQQRQRAHAAGGARHAHAPRRPGARSRGPEGAGGFAMPDRQRRARTRAGRSGRLFQRPRIPHAGRRYTRPVQRRHRHTARALPPRAACGPGEQTALAQRPRCPAPAARSGPARPRGGFARQPARPPRSDHPRGHRGAGPPAAELDGPRPGARAAGHRRARHQCPAHRRPRPAPGPVRRLRRRQERAVGHDGPLHQGRRHRGRPDR